MEQIFSQKLNPNLDMQELDAMLAEFRNDYNQRHFVRNETFKVRTFCISMHADAGAAANAPCTPPHACSSNRTPHTRATL